ncbi:MAG: peptidylprolyl isomerase, partial [Kofleriaceae bacterium]
RGLGRIGATGSPRVVPTLIAALKDADASVVGAAAGAIGVAASLDDGDLGATDALLEAVPRGGALVVEALGRAGTAGAQPALVKLLSEPAAAEVAAFALGRHGRRKLELSEPARKALIATTSSTDTALRYAAVYALAREFQPSSEPAILAPTIAAFVKRLDDPEPEVRAQAVSGIARHKGVAVAVAAGAKLEPLLLDADWRVAVEAVHALGDTAEGKDAIAAAIMRRYPEIENRNPAMAHVVIEGEKALAGATMQPQVAKALSALASSAKATAALPEATRGWIECLGIAGQLRSIPNPDFGELEQCDLPDPLRLPLVAELISADIGSVATRRAAVGRLLGHADARVRASGIGTLAALWKAGDATDHRETLTTLVAALASPDAIIAGAAVEAAPAIYDAIGTGDHALLDAAVVARATAERDPELGASVLELIGKKSIAPGAGACRAAISGDAVRAKAGATCLKALGEAPPALPPVAATPPPVDVSAVIGKALRWRVKTARGDIVIRLDSDAAPWAVATIVALTNKGFYNGLAFHRVVPNFVAQGGDPTETGSGGPGFAIPAEPGTLRDGAGFQLGGVGMADAGRDSGGSQWFAMHSWAPHLDGRYTWIGTIDRGQKYADALVIGDRVVKATIEEIVP